MNREAHGKVTVMAFGKDDRHLSSIPTYGGSMLQKAANATRRRQSAGNRGGGRPYWSDNFKPSERRPDIIRIIPLECKTQRAEDDQLVEEVTPWVEYVEHYHGGLSRSTICSGGPFRNNKKLRDPCYGCDIYWDDYQTRKDSGSLKTNKGKISYAPKYAFAVIDMGTFHKVAQTDAHGNVKMSPKGEPYTEWEKCVGQGCQGCRTAIETKKGHAQPWAMAKAHFNQLNGTAEYIGGCCVTCGGREVVSTVMWQCSNPQCGDLIVDMSTSTLTLDQIQELVYKPYTCRECQTTNYPEEVIQCVNCTPTGREPRRASIFDVNMQVKLQKTGNNDTTTLQVLSFSDPCGVEAEFEHLLTALPDLEKRFAPTPLNIQAEQFKYTPPAQKPAGAGQYTIPKQ